MSAWIETDHELGVGVFTESVPEWLTPAEARALANDLLAAVGDV